MLIFLAALVMLGLFFWAGWIEPRWIHLNSHPIQIKKKIKQPLRILHLSDIHFEAHDHGLFRFFNRLSCETPDFIFITGDIIDHNGGIEHAGRNLKKLKSKYGIFAVLGNHDYYDYQMEDVINGNLPFGKKEPRKKNDLGKLIQMLSDLGIRVLRNDFQDVVVEGDVIRIHGVDDPTTGKADFDKVGANLQDEHLQILLTHSVDAIQHLDSGKIDLLFSGHSHGGQVRLPWLGALITHTRLGRPYAEGIRRYQNTLCCISRGVYVGRAFRFRFLCPPEALMLDITGSTT